MFFWGAATSAYQVEGGIKNDWSKSGFNAGRAVDHYNRFKEDFDLVKSFGHSAHRFSIEWSRIEPEEGKFDSKEIDHYQKVILALRERGLEPFVTLWHFTNPIWFSKLGGFQNKKSSEYFSRYVDFATRNLRGVNFWITINEPEIYAYLTRLRGRWPPRKKSWVLYLRIIHQLIKTHKTAFMIIKKNNPFAQVGIATNGIYFEATHESFLNNLTKIVIKWWWNHFFLKRISGYQDFIGLNYYSRKLIKFAFNLEDCLCESKTGLFSDLGWEIYPEGLYHVLKDLKKYNKPIYITENGLADAQDEKRAQFIKDHIFWMKKAITDDVDVRGYFYWSLLDNYEWDKGFAPRFGLVEVDYKTMERKIRQSAYEYKKIIEKL